MARILGSQISKLRLADRRSETLMVLHYMEPTTAQHLAYQSECLQRVGKSIVSRVPETQLKFGMQIFAGFDTGAFARLDEAGQAVEISCDPADKNYFEKWREHVKQHAPDILQMLAAFVFESAVALGPGRQAAIDSQDADQD